MNRTTGLLVIEVRDSNPNGDPDRESDPRQRADGRGEISPVSLKRKLRDLVENKEGVVWEALSSEMEIGGDEFQILESRDVKRPEVTKMLKSNPEQFKKTYWDARVFGNTFLEEGQGDTIRSGVVHFGLGLSIAPVEIERFTQTKKAPAEEGRSRGMAPLGFRIVQHGVYVAPFFVNPTAASKSGCEERDVELFYRLIPYMFDHTRSVIRSQVGILHAHLINHIGSLGSFNDFQMIDALTPRLNDDLTKGLSLSDYTVPTWSDLPVALRNKAEDYKDLVADHEQ